MAAYWTNKGKADLVSGGIAGRTFRILLATAAPASAAAAADLNFVSDVVANECTFTNYGRKTLANVTSTEDDTGDLAKLDADDPTTYAAAGGAVNNTIAGAWIYRRVGAGDSDAVDILWCWLGFAAGLPTNGGDITLAFAAAGISTVA